MLVRIAFRFVLVFIVLSASLAVAQMISTMAVPTEGIIGLPGLGPWVITGSPFCADIVTTRTQTLADGNRLQNTSTEHFCRDSKGRVRREITPIASRTSQTHVVRMISITDPTTNTAVTLNPLRHTGIKRPFRFIMQPTAPKTSMPPSAPTWQQVPKDNTHVTSRVGDDLVEENLGEDSIHGIVAKGTKITRTVPAGRMGNDLPMTIVTERWYSDDLKTVMLLKQNDPRRGEVTTEVTNVAPGEPDPSLFQIPAGYSVQELHPESPLPPAH